MKQKIVNWLLIASLVSTSIPSVQVFADDSQTTEPPSTQETVTTESLSPWEFTSDTTTYEEPELVEGEISTTQTSDPSSSETSSTQETSQNTGTFPSATDVFEDWSNPILFEKYITITEKEPIVIYQSQELTEIVERKEVKNQTFFAKEQFKLANGKIYVSLYNQAQQLIGYIENDAENKSLVFTENLQGTAKEYNHYIMVVETTEENKAYKDFTFTESFSTDELLNRTYFVKEHYYHFDGKEYLVLTDKKGATVAVIEQSLTVISPDAEGIAQDLAVYNNQDSLIGYVNAKGVDLYAGKLGAKKDFGKFVTISGSHPLWDNELKTSTPSTNYKNQTLEAKYVYANFDGTTYYALYNNQGTLLGNIDAKGVTVTSGQQGIYQTYNKYVMLKGNYPIWTAFDWARSIDLTSYKNKTLEARGIYYHFNGSSYLSLYDNQGKWIGYTNAAGANVASGQQGIYQTYNKYVMLKGDYAIWNGFDWEKNTSAAPYKNKTVQARGIYYHFNGASYLSLYDNQGKWIGYINAAGANVAPGQQGIYQAYNKYVMLKGDYAIWNGFDWAKSTSAAPYKNKTVQARGIYYHFNGASYLSLYDNQGKWIGYINENGVDYRPVHLFVMGHGDTDPGAVGNGTNERDFTRRELLPYLQKYANQLKNNHIIFYDTSRNLYKDTKSGDGLYDLYYGLSSITEIHLDAGIQNIVTGGHVIVHPGKSSYTQDLALASVIGKYNGIWRNTTSSAGLSYRTDLLNLNVSKKVDVSYRLVELGFITNKKDLALLRANLDKIAKEFVQVVTGETL